MSWKIYCIVIYSLCVILSLRGDACDMDIVINRHVENKGFHRELHSSVEITNNQSFFSDCLIIQKELMPSGLYVNPDELADLQRTSQVSGCIGTKVDTEAAKETAEPHEVFVYYTLKQLGRKITGSFILPFHLRYHKPRAIGGEEEIKLVTPVLLLKCNNALPCFHYQQKVMAPCIPCGPEKCEWINIPYKTEVLIINMKVPVGSTQQYYTVLLCTLITTAAGSVYIIKIIIKTKHHWL